MLPSAGSCLVFSSWHLSADIIARFDTLGSLLGWVIANPNSNDLIQGIQIEPLMVFADDCGFFSELARLGVPRVGREHGAEATPRTKSLASETPFQYDAEI